MDRIKQGRKAEGVGPPTILPRGGSKSKAPPGGQRGFGSLAVKRGDVLLPSSNLQASSRLIVPKIFSMCPLGYILRLRMR